MAWQLVAEVLEQCPDIPYRDFRVLMAIAHRAPHDTRQCSPGLEEIAYLANCSTRTARRALGHLAERKLVMLIRQGNRHRRALYELGHMPGRGTPRVGSLEGARASTRGVPLDGEVREPTRGGALELESPPSRGALDGEVREPTRGGALGDLERPLPDLERPHEGVPLNKDTYNEPDRHVSDGEVEVSPARPRTHEEPEPTDAELAARTRPPPAEEEPPEHDYPF